MRELTDHKVGGVNETIKITVLDEPGDGGANGYYLVSGFRRFLQNEPDPQVGMDVPFHCGPVSATGPNGITNEALLAIIIDRLRGFQSGPFACRENALALTKLEEAMHWLQSRTRQRIARGVEGTHQK